jgi:hypothetical protein
VERQVDEYVCSICNCLTKRWGGKDNKQHPRNNEVKNDLCLRTQIKMIRILDSNEDNYRNCLCISRVDDSYEGISESLQALFGILHIKIDIDVERDIDDIRVFHLDSSDVE